MKRRIKILMITVLFSIAKATLGMAQDPGATINKYFNNALNTANKKGNVEAITLEIMVMSPGNGDNGILNGGKNNSQWYVAYGEAKMPITTSKKIAEFGDVNYWFSDRPWYSEDIYKSAGCKPTATSNGGITLAPQADTKNAPFNKNKMEKGIVVFNNYKLNIFNEWGWKVTKAYILGNMLYGEINNSTTFSISYGVTFKSYDR